MSPVSMAAFAVVLGVCLASVRRDSDIFSPGRVFCLVWGVAVGLTDLKLSGLQQEWSMASWLVLLLGLASFLLGTYVVFVLNISRPVVPVARMRTVLPTESLNNERMFRLILLIFGIYLLSYAASVAVKGFIPMFTRFPALMRTQFAVFGVGLPIHAAPAIMLFVVEYLLLVPGERGRKGLLVSVFFLTAGTYFLLLQRYDFAIWAVATLVFMYYASKYIRFRTFGIVLLAFIGLFYWIQNIRLVGHIENFLYFASRMKFNIQYAVFTEPYMYVVSNLENFARTVERLDHHTYGYATFNFLTSLSGLKHWVVDYFAIESTPYLNSGYNMYTFLWDFYRDFGIPGVTVLSFLEGAGIAALYYRMRRAPDPLVVALYGLAVFVMLISFFNHTPALLHFVFNIGVIAFVNHASLRQGRGMVPAAPAA